jgi:hypothetical protein
MTFGSGSIGGEAARRGLTAAEIAAAGREDVRVEQAKLDEADLQELERAEYYDHPLPRIATGRVRADRGFFGRLLDLLRPAA